MDRWIVWEHNDLINAELLLMLIRDSIEFQLLRENVISETRYDFSDACEACQFPFRQIGPVCMDKMSFASVLEGTVIAKNLDGEDVAKEDFKELMERCQLTGIDFTPARDMAGNDTNTPPVYQIIVTSVMPPLFSKSIPCEEGYRCETCGRFSLPDQPRYSRKTIDWKNLKDFNYTYEASIQDVPVLQRHAIITKPKVYKIFIENGIDRDQVDWEVIPVVD